VRGILHSGNRAEGVLSHPFAVRKQLEQSPAAAATIDMALRCRAAWVLPIDRAPIADGAVLLALDGRITAVGPDAEVPAPPGVERLEFPSSALLPGLVNTHTHLELTGLDGQVTDQDFPSWIRKVIALKAERSPDDFLAAARQGIR